MRATDIGPDSRPRRSPHAHTEVLDGEGVILDEAHHHLHRLNATATIVWSCLDGTGTVAEIARDVADQYGRDPEATTAEVLALARDLGARGLLEGVEPDPDVDERRARD